MHFVPYTATAEARRVCCPVTAEYVKLLDISLVSKTSVRSQISIRAASGTPSFSLLLPHSGVAMIISPDGNVRDGMELGGMKRGLQQSSAVALVPDPMCNGPFPFLSERRLRRRR